MAKHRVWLRVLGATAVVWGGATLVKHWWSHEPWGHAALAGIAFGILGLTAAVNVERTRFRRARADRP